MYICTSGNCTNRRICRYILVNNITQLNFINANWVQVAETLEELSVSDRITATKQSLEAEFNGTAYIIEVDSHNWKIRVPSTAFSRIKSNIQNFFSGDDSSDVIATLIRDNEDKITLRHKFKFSIKSMEEI